MHLKQHRLQITGKGGKFVLKEDKMIEQEIEKAAHKLGILRNKEEQLKNRLRIVQDQIYNLDLHISKLVKRYIGKE